MKTCTKCETLYKLFTMLKLDKPNASNYRDYWLITELFVALHDGKDYCRGESQV